MRGSMAVLCLPPHYRTNYSRLNSHRSAIPLIIYYVARFPLFFLLCNCETQPSTGIEKWTDGLLTQSSSCIRLRRYRDKQLSPCVCLRSYTIWIHRPRHKSHKRAVTQETAWESHVSTEARSPRLPYLSPTTDEMWQWTSIVFIVCRTGSGVHLPGRGSFNVRITPYLIANQP